MKTYIDPFFVVKLQALRRRKRTLTPHTNASGVRILLVRNHLVLLRQVIKKLAVRHELHRFQDPAHLRDLLAVCGREGGREGGSVRFFPGRQLSRHVC